MTWKINPDYWIQRTWARNKPIWVREGELETVRGYTYRLVEEPNQAPTMYISTYQVGLLRQENVLGIRNTVRSNHAKIVEVAPQIAVMSGWLSNWASLDPTTEVITNGQVLHFGRAITEVENTPWLQVDHQWQLAKLALVDRAYTAVVFAVRRGPRGWYPEYYQEFAIAEHPRKMAVLVVSPDGGAALWIGCDYISGFTGAPPNLNDLSQIYPYLAHRMARRYKTTAKSFFERMAFDAL